MVVMLAVLHSWLPLVADGLRWTVSVSTAVAPAGNVPMVHVIGPVPPMAGVVHVQPAGAAADTNVVPAGVESPTETL